MARRPGLLSPFALLRRNALYKGLLGGRRGWMAIGAAVWAPRLIKKLLGRQEEIVLTEKLRPGQAIRLEAIPQSTRAERRAVHRDQ